MVMTTPMTTETINHISLPEVISVAALNRLLRQQLERLPIRWVVGEVSNFTIASSGHCYFSLKDTHTQIRCVLFRQQAMLLPFCLNDGMQIEVQAKLSVFEARGDYQLLVETARLAGIGERYQAFERLKQQLAAEGLFDSQRKRPLPTIIHRVGLITSRQAAVLHDVLTTLRRRAPFIKIIIYPTAVQGSTAPAQIAAALATANQRREVDVLLVCRGGGSLEDLWAFNESVVARAIASSQIPVVSAIGHETDISIADFVADLRAPTPTAAAEMISICRQHHQQQLQNLQRRCVSALHRYWQQQIQMLDQLAHQRVHPAQRLMRQQWQLHQWQQRLSISLQRWHDQQQHKLRQQQLAYQHARPSVLALWQQLNQRKQRLCYLIQHGLSAQQQHLAAIAAKWQSLDPLAVLARGYSIVSNAEGKILRTSDGIKHGTTLSVLLAHGQLTVSVIEHFSDTSPPTSTKKAKAGTSIIDSSA